MFILEVLVDKSGGGSSVQTTNYDVKKIELSKEKVLLTVTWPGKI